MKLLREIHDSDIEKKDIPGIRYAVRHAARAVVFDEEGNVAVLFL